jgi:hypothetical protein
MDHLFTPVLPTSKTIDVPYVCTDQGSYDDLGFLTFPERAGISFDRLSQTDHEQMNAVLGKLQAWLWFGLLGETLGIGSRTNRPQKITSFASFIDVRADGSKWLTTRSLHEHASLSMQSRNSDTNREFLQARFDACIVTAAEALSVLLGGCDELATRSHAFAVILAIQALHETLSSLRRLNHTVRSRDQRCHTFNNTVLVDRLLSEAGWPSLTVEWLPKLISVRYFLSLKQPHDFYALTDCPKGFGEAAPDCSIRHRAPECNCKQVEIDDERICQAIAGNRTILWSYCQNETGEKELAELPVSLGELDDQPEYVAFSHVSSQGLGSSRSHSLPDCQLAFLQALADAACSSSKRPAKFWLDTLCIPLHGAARKAALGGANQIYSTASAVVVLDDYLMRASVGSTFDAMLRVRYSAWASRLWTLQEGAVSKRLCIKFANTTYNFSDLLADMLQPRLHGTLPEYCHYLHDFPDKIYLHAEQLVRRLKSLQSISQGSGSADKASLRATLRYVLLGLPMYRFLVKDWEKGRVDDALNDIEPRTGN